MMLHSASSSSRTNGSEDCWACSHGPSSTQACRAPAATGPVVNWSRVPVDDAMLSRLFGGATVHHAGGTSTVADDEALAEELARCATVSVLCKAWEPPLLELEDFLRSLLGQSPDAVAQLVPVRVRDGVPAAALERDMRVWERAFPGLSVRLASMPEGQAR